VIRFLSNWGAISPRQAGFRGIGHAVVAVVIGGTLGFVLYVLQGAPTLNPVVIINAFAQVLVGSIAEVLVCWAVVGSLARAILRDGRGRWVSVILAALIASVLFGVFHFAHSPPFNTVALAAFFYELAATEVSEEHHELIP
jgi:membrane protease YdiL (CAAX protease family)